MKDEDVIRELKVSPEERIELLKDAQAGDRLRAANSVVARMGEAIPCRELKGHQVNPVNQGITILANAQYVTAGGAPRDYYVQAGTSAYQLRFHEGDPAVVGTTGLTFEALLEIMVDRMGHFQNGPNACKNNDLAMRCMIEARRLLNEVA